MNEAILSQLYLKDTAFQDLMQERIHNVLLVASTYDAFIMEDDGRVEEQIFFEYASLNLSSPPRVTRVSNYDEAFANLSQKNFDLVIAMPGVELSTTFAAAKEFKRLYHSIPFVVLTPFSREVSRRLQGEDLSAVDYVFSWLGNVDLLVAIIKLLEDKMNAANDVKTVGIQMILLVEDSVRFYSSVLPTLYKFILQQSKIFSTEALNAHETMLRMRGRPKVMLARDYEEACRLYQEYGENILGVISDISFKREGEKDPMAGLAFAQYLREHDPHLPIIMESSDASNRISADRIKCSFIDKNSKKFPVDLGQAIMDNFGFGDFIIRDPDNGQEIMRIRDLKDMQKQIFSIPDKSLLHHALRNDISRWLYSRALFPIAQVVKMHRFRDISEVPAARQLFFDLIVKYRKMKNRGVVAEFKKERFDRYSNFARIGQGSLGGKGRGIAFIDSIIKNNPVCDSFHGASIQIPHTVVLCTDVFDMFMEQNSLYPAALSQAPDSEILALFLAAELPQSVREDISAIYDVMDGAIAVRSSSLLEDSHYQPFAGVYATYMVPRGNDKATTVRMLEDAVKAVYASVFYADSKAYMTATRNVIDQEKMAVILQEVVGHRHGDYFYPSISGVGRSLNYYPLGNELPSDGVAEVAIGLGKYIVDGGKALRFSPLHPKKILQTSTIDLALRDTQTKFLAINCHENGNPLSCDDNFNLASLNVTDAGSRGELTHLVSTFDYENERLVPGDTGRGRKVATLAGVLEHNAFPLADAIHFMLTTGESQMGRPVEIEFACNLAQNLSADSEQKGEIYWLQIRPMVDRREMSTDTISDFSDDQLVLSSHNALGFGVFSDIRHIVMVKPECFSSINNWAIAEEIEKINRNFTELGQNYILIGVGRWGSSDPALGIPVKWAHISQAQLLVEMALKEGGIEPSQGTHFFQNLTSMGVGYFASDTRLGDRLDVDWIENNAEEITAGKYVNTYRFASPLTIRINGLKAQGVVTKT